MPIATSPGRSGFGPSLSLSYDSGSGNGPFGFGWSLSLPSITRKTDKGLPRYLDGYGQIRDSDTFLLSGAEDLVAAYRQNAGGWARDQQGLILLDDEEIDGYRVRRYHPRIEGQFARIERWTLLSDQQDVHWRSITRDNILTLYGHDANSRIVDPENGARIFSWLICETRDDKGNAMLYRYKAEDGAGVDYGRVFERNRGRPDDRRRTANRYLKHIYYGNRAPLLDEEGRRPRFLDRDKIQDQIAHGGFMFEVVFDYGEHDGDAPAPDDAGTWDYRADAFSSYRPGFELRTTRLCRRALMFHHFQEDGEVGRNCLVRSTDLGYDGQRDSAAISGPVYAFLASVRQMSYRRNATGYDRRGTPPVTFEYTQPAVEEAVHDIDAESLENLPNGLETASYRWLDLHGEGIPGILTEQAGAWFYKRNLSPIGLRPPEFAPSEFVAQKPNVALAGEAAEFMDLAGDGQPDLVVLDGPVPGLYEHDEDEGWLPFRPFSSSANRAVRGPNVRFIDLDGDGHADILITEDDTFVWHLSLAEDGFGPAERSAQARDEEQGPQLVFADASQSIYLADMSGDGLTDLVRIRSGEVCYWPSLGYCRFGAKVAMEMSPDFDNPDQFRQSRVRLADIDGSGTTDIIYLHRDGVRLYFNLSGNGWSLPQTVAAYPRVDDFVSVVPIDLFGNGTACLVWSSPHPGDGGAQMRYVDLMGGKKPHLLVRVANNLGAETRIDYASSTKFYLQDRLNGTPWVTRLSFPVHVVEKVTVTDKWRNTTFTSAYSYHHGYFDGDEWEFRGFGRVEHLDTESYGDFAAGNTASPYITDDRALHQPPIKTVTWYHTGAFLDRERILTQFQHEYFPNWLNAPLPAGFKERSLPAPDLGDEELSIAEWREALRACKGMVLRQEVYELDLDALERPGDPRHVPVKLFSTAYGNCRIRRLQPQEANAYAVFLVMASEALTCHYELPLTSGELHPDPRVAHTLNLRHDEYGNVLQTVDVVYPRLILFEEDALDADTLTAIRRVQKQRHLVYTETRYTKDRLDTDEQRLRMLCETMTYELAIPDGGGGDYITIGELAKWALSTYYHPTAPPAEIVAVADIPYHAVPDGVSWQKRLVEHVRTLYVSADLANPAPFGELGPLGLVFEHYRLALTDSLLEAIFNSADGTSKLDQAIDGPRSARVLLDRPETSGYLSGATLTTRFASISPAELAGQYWVRSGIAGFAGDAAKHFYLPVRYTDAFGNATNVTYDACDLFVAASTDALNNTVLVSQFDYRVLAPREMRDVNDNLSEVFFDVLGFPTAMALKGKGDGADDLSGFDASTANLGRVQPPLTALRTFFDSADLDEAQARDWLVNATVRHIYDFGEIEQALADGTRTTQWAHHPPCACAILREQHVRQLAAGESSPIQAAFEYSDGLGGMIVTKIQAEPQAPGQPLRWVASGKVIFNNKGNPVKHFEPYFSAAGHRFEEPEEAGLATIIYYDAIGRVVRTEMPDGSFDRDEFSPWHVRSFDRNDTVLEPGNGWYARKTAAGATAEEKRAAQLAAGHAGTPTLTVLDSLGRAVVAIAHNRVKTAAGAVEEEMYPTFTRLDAEGKALWIRDARGNLAVQYLVPPVADGEADNPSNYAPGYDIAGNLLFQHSADGGDRWTLSDAVSKPMVAWDSRNHILYTVYDQLHRPVASYVKGTDPADANKVIQFERVLYGDTPGNGLPDSPADDQTRKLNLRGRVYRHYDKAGLATSVGTNPATGSAEAFDFKGNALRSTRQWLQNYKQTPDWSQAPALDAEIFSRSTRYDALNREIQHVAPYSNRPGATLDVIRPGYNAANLLGRVDVWLELAAEPPALLDPATATLHAVANIDYNAKGQRILIEHNEAGHRIVTRCSYEPDTFRLSRLVSTRPLHPQAEKRTLQDLSYSYDPVGNITAIRDDAQQIVFFDNSTIPPSNSYVYDPLYRLIRAEGREHAAQNNVQRDATSFAPVIGIPFPNSPEALQRYVEDYEYDSVGNIMTLRHVGGANLRWTRRYQYGSAGNRLIATRVPGDPDGLPDYPNAPGYTARYGYDAHGNMTSMPHLPAMEWAFEDQLSATQRQVNNGGAAQKTWYVYDACGDRVRKITETAKGKPKEERIYLGNIELYRAYEADGQTVKLERETLQVTDDNRRVALVETRTRLIGADPAPRQLVRFQIGNHLGTACLELDDQAQLISYEEYHPYGSTAYQASRSQTETPKHYRFTGKERDEETGLSYHGARYYALWLGRWVSCDPAGMATGINLFLYSEASPICLADYDGMDPTHPEDANTRGFWVEGKTSAGSTAPSNTPVEPDIVMEVPITGAPIESRDRGFDKKMRDKAIANRSRMTGRDPREYHLGHEKDNVLLMPDEKTRGVPERRVTPDKTGNLNKSGAARVEADRRRAASEKEGKKAWEETDPNKFARPGERDLYDIRAAKKAAAKKAAAANQKRAATKPAPKPTEPAPKAAGAKFRAGARKSQGGFAGGGGPRGGPRARSGSGLVGKAAGVVGIALLARELAKAKTNQERAEILKDAAVGAVIIAEVAEVPVVGPWVAAGVTGLGLGIGVGTFLAEDVIPDSVHRAVGKTIVEKGFGASPHDIEILEDMSVFGWRPFAP
ncbi:FG-GAP-like repeat-containing protein [Mesorhizobium sp. M0933]